MAKNMAAITNGIVTNVIWCSDSEPETDTIINPADRPIAIGDTYSDGKFYRGGVEILTPLEEAQEQLESLSAQNAELLDAMAAMVDDVYQSDTEIIGG